MRSNDELQKLAQELAQDYIARNKLANFVPVGEYLMSEAAAEEFENQDVFATLEDFINAMPPGVRGIHAISMAPKVSRLANSMESQLFQVETFVTPTDEDLDERMDIEDSSLFRVDSPYNLPKDQSLANVHRDWNESNSNNHYDPSFYVVDDSTPDYSITDWPRDKTVVPEYNWNTHKENDKKFGGSSCGGDCGCNCDDCDCKPKPSLTPALGPQLTSDLSPGLSQGDLLEHIWHGLTFGG